VGLYPIISVAGMWIKSIWRQIRMNTKGLGMMAGPMLKMVKNMVPHEEPNNSSAVFVKDIIDVFIPESDEPMMGEVEEIITDMVVITVNRNPEAFKEKLAILETKIQRFFEREG
jgi:hypothetical protein